MVDEILKFNVLQLRPDRVVFLVGASFSVLFAVHAIASYPGEFLAFGNPAMRPLEYFLTLRVV